MSYQVVPLQLDEHRDALLRLWRRNFKGMWMDDCADRRASWLYEENPFGPTRTWLAVETRTDEAIGCSSVFPTHRYIRGRVVRVGIPIDFAVEPRHRTAGAALALQGALTRESRRAGFECLIGKPNRKAFPILNQVGYRPIGQSTEWVKVLEPSEKIDVRPTTWYTEEILNSADERFDELWKTASTQCQNVGEKTAVYLNWRYFGFTEMGYHLYCLVHREDQRLAGYIVYSRMETGAFIAELFSDDLIGGGVEELLLRFACCMQMDGREWIALSYLGAPSLADRVTQLGFARRNRLHTLLAYVDAECDADLRDQIFDVGNSLVFGGEMDLF